MNPVANKNLCVYLAASFRLDFTSASTLWKRKAFLDTVLSAIAQEVGRLYEIIHPSEGLNKITLKLDPKKTGSLDLATQFLSRDDQPPNAYFSESHLDSLGLCIFLALAAMKDPQLTILGNAGRNTETLPAKEA